MSGLRKFLPAFAASGLRTEPKEEGDGIPARLSDEAVAIPCSRSQRHWSRRAAARKRVSMTQNAPWFLSTRSGIKGVRATWMKTDSVWLGSDLDVEGAGCDVFKAVSLF